MNPGNMRQAHVYCRWCKQEKTIIIMVFVARCREVCNLVRESRCVPFFHLGSSSFLSTICVAVWLFLSYPAQETFFTHGYLKNLIQFLLHFALHNCQVGKKIIVPSSLCSQSITQTHTCANRPKRIQFFAFVSNCVTCTQ